jgi:hypothetical protein
MRENLVGTVFVVAFLGKRLRIAGLIGLLFALSGASGIQGQLLGQPFKDCRWQSNSIDLDGDGQDDFEHSMGLCS